MAVPVIDLFAGPGGLNEGFSHTVDGRGRPAFETVLSVECDVWAHRTLETRALFRKLLRCDRVEAYRSYVSGAISREDLFSGAGVLGAAARKEAMCATLGRAEDDAAIEESIARELRRRGGECVLIGGPPCQAYSLAGRSRRTNDTSFASDKKHILYREYLRIVRRFRPAVFVMENVPGLLSSKLQGKSTFSMICDDLTGAGYSLHALNGSTSGKDADPSRFVVQADEFGVPQARARLFILGLRSDLRLAPGTLRQPDPGVIRTVGDVIADLPKIRSRLSKTPDSGSGWADQIASMCRRPDADYGDPVLAGRIRDGVKALNSDLPVGRPVMDRRLPAPAVLADWYVDTDVGVLNHNSRAHIPEDLQRYFFWSTYGLLRHRSPKLDEVPKFLLPKHGNVGASQNMPFADRFRVQLRGRPSTTIVSHIAKDGHYYIHPDPKQCRSFSVREAARLQTFPDSYFFEGPVTEQYHQVGNAVPPYLAAQLGRLVHEVLSGSR